MNQTAECATKCVYGVIIWYNNAVGKCLLDFLAGIKVLYSYRFILYFEYCSFTGVDSVFLQVTSLLYVHGLIMMSSLS